MDGAERALDVGDGAAPVVFAGDVEDVIDARAPVEVGRQRNAAGPHHGFTDRRADGAGGAGDQHDLVPETPHAPVVAAARPAAQAGARAVSSDGRAVRPDRWTI